MNEISTLLYFTILLTDGVGAEGWKLVVGCDDNAVPRFFWVRVLQKKTKLLSAQEFKSLKETISQAQFSQVDLALEFAIDKILEAID